MKAYLRSSGVGVWAAECVETLGVADIRKAFLHGLHLLRVLRKHPSQWKSVGEEYQPLWKRQETFFQIFFYCTFLWNESIRGRATNILVYRDYWVAWGKDQEKKKKTYTPEGRAAVSTGPWNTYGRGTGALKRPPSRDPGAWGLPNPNINPNPNWDLIRTIDILLPWFLRTI